MMDEQRRPFTGHDRYVTLAVLALAGIGMVAVYSAIAFMAATKSGGHTAQLLLRHGVRVALALGVLVALSLVDYRLVVRRFGRAGLVAALLLLAYLQLARLMGGVDWPLMETTATASGAWRWVRLGTLSFQPSDVARVALVLVLAYLLGRKQLYIGDFRRAFVPLMVWIGVTVLLIGVNDFSTAGLVGVTAAAMCVVGRVRLLHLGSLAVPMAFAAVLILTNSEERMARVTTYLDCNIRMEVERCDARGDAYQTIQARLAVANGGLTGVGPGKSVQRDHLPAPYNDFIFAIITEEYGIVGAVFLLLLFSLVLVRGFLRIARDAPDPTGLFLATGATTMVALYAFVHAGVATGLLPVTGLPLPFVSYGGTSMLASGALIGILLNVSRQAQS